MTSAVPFAARIGSTSTIVQPDRSFRPASLRASSVSTAWAGRRVALQGAPASMARWLLLLDGIADALMLVPRDACRAVCGRFVELGGADCVLRDADPSGSPWSDLNLPCVVDSDLAKSLPEPPPGKSHSVSGGTSWVLATSGTTKLPKLVSHTLDSLAVSARRDDRFVDYRWGLLYDPARMAGLQVFLQALIGDSMLLAPAPGASLLDQAAWLEGAGCSAISATPTQWRRLLMTESGRRLPLRQATLGGEIADATTLAAISRAFPQSRITHVYASTEAGVGFAVHDGRPGFPAAWLGTTHAGVHMRIGDNGCLWIGREHMPQQYVGDAHALVCEGWIDTGDLVQVENHRAQFLGRANGTINVGGNKVVPEEVERVIGALDGVAGVLVRGKQSSVMGMLVEAVIQVAPGVTLETNAIKSHCKQYLANYKVPAFVHLVDELPVSGAGKLMRTVS